MQKNSKIGSFPGANPEKGVYFFEKWKNEKKHGSSDFSVTAEILAELLALSLDGWGHQVSRECQKCEWALLLEKWGQLVGTCKTRSAEPGPRQTCDLQLVWQS